MICKQKCRHLLILEHIFTIMLIFSEAYCFKFTM